ncbi:hypothetical protein D3C81_1513180 [compost metagenome]
MHGISDVGRNQAGGDVQPVVAQLGHPTREKARCQGVCRGHLHHLTLPAFQMMQVAENFAQLVDNSTRRDEKQLAGLCQLDRRAGTIHQLQAQGCFQAANAPAEGRLGDETPLCRLGKTAGGGQRAEVFQPFAFKVHEAHLLACTKMEHARMSIGVT